MHKRVSLLIAFGILAAAHAACAQSLTYGPILGRGLTPDQMIVKWGTGAANDATAVSLRLHGTASFSTVNGAASQDHEVVLTGLQPGAQYDYYVQSGGAQSATNTFATCPATAVPMDVVFYGDSRDDPSEHAKLVSLFLNKAPDMVFESGDLVMTGAYNLYLSEFFPAVKQLAATTPFMAVPGNHDALSTLTSNFGLLFPAPRAAGAAWQPYYSFACGNVRYIGLNANSPTDNAQLTFLNAQLNSAKSDSAIDHVIVWFHQSAYSPGEHGDDATVQANWVPLFDDPANKVHLVFSGHDHIYARLHDGAANGPTYVVSGGAGAVLYSVGHASKGTVDAQKSTYNFVLLHINGGLLSGTAFDDTGAQLDAFSVGSNSGNGGNGGAGSGGTGGAGNGGSGGAGGANGAPDGGGAGNGGMGGANGADANTGCGFGGRAAGAGGLLVIAVFGGFLLRRRKLP